MDCIFCSVDNNKRVYDYVVEKEYLVSEYNKLVDKKSYKCTVFINAQGEPLLYEPLPELIKEIKANKKTERVVLITNGTLLTSNLCRKLINSGLDQINVSINAINPFIAKKLANKNYNVKKVLEMCKFLSNYIDVVITPVYLKGYNDDEIEKIIEFSKSINVKVSVQNFLNYKFGKNPIKELSFNKFLNYINKSKDKYKNVLLNNGDIPINKDPVLEKPFKKGQIIKVKLIAPGRLKNEKLGVYKNVNRVISVIGSDKNIGEYEKIKIMRTKHNIFVGKVI